MTAAPDGATTLPDTAEPDPTTTAPADPADPTSPTTSEAPAPVLVDPIVAIDSEGDAVLISDVSDGPVLLFDGPSRAELAEATEGPGPNITDHVSVSPDGATAYVGTCCEPISGAYLATEPPAEATFEAMPAEGYNPTVSPDGALLAVGVILGVVKVIERTLTSELSVEDSSGFPTDLVGAFTPYDVMWTAPDTFAVLGTFETDWVVVPGAVDEAGTVLISPAFPVADFTDFETVFDFAGYRDDGSVIVHRSGDGVATAYDTDGTPAGEVNLGGPSRSAWIEPDRDMLRVDSQGTLTVGDVALSGDYQWART
jgi:hypothetical protein